MSNGGDQVSGTVIWRMGEALHDATLDGAWDFETRAGRYMNDARMQVVDE